MPEVGNVLHDLLLERLGVALTSDCDCDKWVMLMNAWGPKGCRENLSKIVGALLNEAQRRSWKLSGRPLLSIAARVGTFTPWGRAYARAWARSLVREAIEQCEEGCQ